MTLTIVARDEDKGLLGVAQATNPLSVGGRCPFIRSNVGAVSTQAFTDPGLGPLAIELLTLGYHPEKVLKELKETDPHYEHRQIGIVDKNGRAAVYTGKENKQYSGAVSGKNFVVMGNMLKTDEVVPAMHRAWLDTEGELFEDRLLAAVTAGRDKGGDAGGHRSSCLIVYETESYARTDLRVDFVPKVEGQPDAVDALAEVLKRWRPLIEYYKFRPHDPTVPGWADWLEQQGIPFKD